MQPIFEGTFLSPEAVAELLSVRTDDVLDLLESGELLGIRVGQHGPWRIHDAHVMTFINDGYDKARRELLWNEAALANVVDFADGTAL
jgi:excisionase family DNA binding protein